MLLCSELLDCLLFDTNGHGMPFPATFLLVYDKFLSAVLVAAAATAFIFRARYFYDYIVVKNRLQLRPPAHYRRSWHNGTRDDRTGARLERRACAGRWRWADRRHSARHQVTSA